MSTHQDHARGVAEGVEVDELLDLAGQAEEGGVHDVGEVAGEGLHVAAGLGGGEGGGPVVLGGLDEVVDLGVHELEYALLRRLLVAPELLRRRQRQRPARRRRRPRLDQQLLQLLARRLEVLQVDQDLHDLAQVLRAQPLHQRLAHLLREQLVQGLPDNVSITNQNQRPLHHIVSYLSAAESGISYLSQSLVNLIRVLEVIIREEIELVEKIPDVDAAQWVHLREWQDAGKPGRWGCQKNEVGREDEDGHSRKVFDVLVLREPADVNNFLVLFPRVDGHGHVVIGGNDLEWSIPTLSSATGNMNNRGCSAHLLEILAEPPLQEIGVLVEQIHQKFIKPRDRITPALYAC